MKLIRTVNEFEDLVGRKEAEVSVHIANGKKEYRVYQHDVHMYNVTEYVYKELLKECV